MNKSIRFLSLITIVFVAVLLTNTISKKNESKIKNVAESYEIRAVKAPSYMELAGERVPLEKADVKEHMDRELLVNTYWQSNGVLLIKRANKFFPIIEPLLEKYGVPDDFKYLCVAESALINIPSSKGAAGYWHFMPATGREYGLEVNRNVDERYNLEKSTRVAAEYLKKAKKKLGSWTLAAAAYNAGNGRISQRLKQQQVDNYYDLLLNSETSRYVFRILALKEVLGNPNKYGFIYDQEDLYTFPTTYNVQVNTSIANITNFAKKYEVTYKELKLVNPWLRESKLNNKSNKTYTIKIPMN
ncbi:lytic transglycosylase domain-containing protein [Tenacibaculum finnmarkense]|uniref:Transglycosylase SLT domain-containing protein n=1 Tax=Tenacibaculum finnmarkense genomovar finnmarkense TaxID=1458503 RepID=A0AAP1WGJ6_9FLAO|nr:lytic transglycosylase domain-containing protein [Tenacibaculum finnmarkense]MBE7653064.1 transglycosylase SLT domain-containing protein [Tenacibaculum finnmarkense genomovar finnmarkense]MBE7695365.1 transglycosylase SLT domain-containing protein [Tenacibaculum finnmarkense genomovar finnmarkense]MCD8427491.1 lytic transglycosylase domain-containing protein [Tenacibaculum finnmarkense genomovar finnmarkense]MCG8731268.1 lytic transglycosylase domain-containing protein [Tenacibaculum finnmar